jgi:PAS domain S-box-containing protein
MNNDRIRVLFVDDEEHNLKAFRAAFRRDMDVLLANSGAEALELLEKESVHVIISDQRMPGMTGSEFLAIARERYPTAMRMLLTGYADMEAVIAAVNNGGIYAYANKPWDESDIRLRINQAFEIYQLRKEKERLLHQYKQVFDASGDPIVLVDENCKVMEANGAWAKLIGMGPGNMIGACFADHVEDPSGLVRSLKKARKGSEFMNVDLTLRTLDGAQIDCLMTATYLGRKSGGRPVFQAIIKDITDRKQEEKRLRRLNSDLDKRVAVRTAQLMEAMEDIGAFSYTVAHDLRSPLKNIAALTEHLRDSAREGAAPEDLVEFSERIGKGSARLIELVDDLLRFSQTNNREIERQMVDLTTLVRDVIEEQVPEDRLPQIEMDIPPTADVFADAPMLKVVLHNLMSNALKFSRNVESPRITIGHRREEERDILFVRDNGVGFDPQHKEQAFGAFKRLHNNSQFEGTGLGLAIVHRVISRHGGESWAESQPGQGTTIHVALPREGQERRTPPFFKVA